MASRDRVNAAIQFERPESLPCNEDFWDDTLPTWYGQGMPSDVIAADYFDYDICTMSIDSSPRFEQNILNRTPGWITYEDRFGYTIKKQVGISSTMAFSNHQTTDRDAWERIKPQFKVSDDANEPARLDEASYFAHFGPYPTWDEAFQKYQRLYASGRYMLFDFYGPSEATWRHRGFETFLMDVAVDPEWVREMADTYLHLVTAILEHCLNRQMKPDGIFMIDDLGSTQSMLMSPKSWREIFKPAWRRFGDYLKKNGIDFWMHSDGAIQPVLDDLLEVGVRVFNPLQSSAGLDVVALREHYGNRMVFYENIDAFKMLGSRSELESEIHRKVPLARQGGYIFHSDHSVPPQVTFDQYRWMLKTAREIFNG